MMIKVELLDTPTALTVSKTLAPDFWVQIYWIEWQVDWLGKLFLKNETTVSPRKPSEKPWN
jgi:hypothetical protein